MTAAISNTLLPHRKLLSPHTIHVCGYTLHPAQVRHKSDMAQVCSSEPPTRLANSSLLWPRYSRCAITLPSQRSTLDTQRPGPPQPGPTAPAPEFLLKFGILWREARRSLYPESSVYTAAFHQALAAFPVELRKAGLAGISTRELRLLKKSSRPIRSLCCCPI